MQTIDQPNKVTETKTKIRTKEQQLEIAINVFSDSHQCPDDFMILFQTVHQVTRQGSGLTWSQVREILENNVN